MKSTEHQKLKELLAMEVTPLPNPDFTSNTLQKIKNVESVATTPKKARFELPMLYPIMAYAFLLLLYSVVQFFTAITSGGGKQWGLVFSDSLFYILGHPIIISVVISFCILNYLDVYLKKTMGKKAIVINKA